jgi:hypothetical protein
MTTIATLEAQFLTLLQGPSGRLAYWNDYRQQAEAAADYPAAAVSPAMTYVIGSNKEVRLQPLYTPDWKTIPLFTNAETAKQFARELFRIAMGVYPESYTGGLIGVTVASEDLAKLTPEAQEQYLADNPSVTVLAPQPVSPVSSEPVSSGTSTAPASTLPAPLPDGSLPGVSGPIRPGPSMPTGGTATTMTIQPVSSINLVTSDAVSNASGVQPGSMTLGDRIKAVPVVVWALLGIVGVMVLARSRS